MYALDHRTTCIISIMLKEDAALKACDMNYQEQKR